MKKFIIAASFVSVIAVILFVPFIKNPEDKIITETDNGYEYCGTNYGGVDFNEFNDINYINYDSYCYSFDLDSDNFDKVYDKKFGSVF